MIVSLYYLDIAKITSTLLHVNPGTGKHSLSLFKQAKQKIQR